MDSTDQLQRSRSLELVLLEHGLDSEISQGLLISLLQAGDTESCRRAVSRWLLAKAMRQGKLASDRLVSPAEYPGLREVVHHFVDAHAPFIPDEPFLLDPTAVAREVWLAWMNDQLTLQIPVSHEITPEDDEDALRGGVMAAVLHALMPALTPPEAAAMARKLYWAVNHPNDAINALAEAKEAGTEPDFPEA